jgi:hypothetical protein
MPSDAGIFRIDLATVAVKNVSAGFSAQPSGLSSPGHYTRKNYFTRISFFLTFVVIFYGDVLKRGPGNHRHKISLYARRRLLTER